jgi:hypothetical protein
MALDIVFNELSLATLAADRVNAKDSMRRLVDVIIRAARVGMRNTLRAPRGFESLEIAPDYSIYRWRTDPTVRREYKNYFASSITKLAYFDSIPEIEDRLQMLEYRHDGSPAKGFGVASVLDTIAISLDARGDWTVSHVDVQREWIDLDGNGEVQSDNQRLKHASVTAHIDTHATWIRERVRMGAVDGRDLWDRRFQLFRGLEFCVSVKEQLAAIGASDVLFQPVYQRLRELDEFSLTWAQGPFDKDKIPTKTTPEHKQTLETSPEAFTFRCPDGLNRLFSMHVRATPGPWRIHFLPIGPGSRLIIGRIGRKPVE